MMRVLSKPILSRAAAALAGLAVTSLLFACASAPLDKEDTDVAATAGTGSVVPEPTAGSAATPPSNAPTYQKQDYPAGPYGLGVRSTIENFTFLGWHEPKAANYDVSKLEQLSLAEYYNPDGRSNLKLIWINASAVWCSVCRAEMADIKDNGVYASFAPRGVQMLVTLFEDNKYGPAKPSDLRNWGLAPDHDIAYSLALDPGFKLGALFTSDATPLNLLVDATTMKVIDASMGYSTDYWQRVDRLLAKL
jgi:hypothetical protein